MQLRRGLESQQEREQRGGLRIEELRSFADVLSELEGVLGAIGQREGHHFA